MLKFFKNLGVTLLVFVLLAVLAWILSYSLRMTGNFLQNIQTARQCRNDIFIVLFLHFLTPCFCSNISYLKVIFNSES